MSNMVESLNPNGFSANDYVILIFRDNDIYNQENQNVYNQLESCNIFVKHKYKITYRYDLPVIHQINKDIIELNN